jgi:hypothetical protein
MTNENNEQHRTDAIEEAIKRALDAVRGLPPGDGGLALLMAVAVLTRLNAEEFRNLKKGEKHV